MVNAETVEQITVRSFLRVKDDVRQMARWVAYNKREHELLQERIKELEAKLKERKASKVVTKTVVRKVKPKRTFVGSKEARKVHASNCMHVRNIKRSNRTVFHDMKDARKEGFVKCACVA